MGLGQTPSSPSINPDGYKQTHNIFDVGWQQNPSIVEMAATIRTHRHAPHQDSWRCKSATSSAGRPVNFITRAMLSPSASIARAIAH